MNRETHSSRISDTRPRSPYLAAIALLLAALIACGDHYLHTNPYDPAYPVQAAIAGPDTLFSLGEVGQYTVQTNPPWPDSGLVWAIDTFTNYFIVPGLCTVQLSDGSTVLSANGTGSYRSIAPPLEPYTFKVAVDVWLGTIDTTVSIGLCTGETVTIQTRAPRHVAYKTVVVTQRVTSIQLRCPDTHSCAALAVGDSAFIWVDGFDASGKEIAALTSATANPATGNPIVPYATNDTAILRVQKGSNPVAVYVSRDSTIARSTPIGIRVARVMAVNPGTTWIVATRGVLADSLQVIVR